LLFNAGDKFDAAWVQKTGEVYKTSIRVERGPVDFRQINSAINQLSER